MNRKYFLVAAFLTLSLSFTACNSSNNKKDAGKSLEKGIEELKEDAKEVDSSASDLFNSEKKDVKHAADEIIEDVERKVDEIE